MDAGIDASSIVLWDGGPADSGEQWAPVPGYESAYLVSNLGRVMRILGGTGVRGAPRIMKTPLNKDGYPTVRLSMNGVPKTFNVHKLVAIVFLGKPPHDIAGDFEVHHRNAQRSDCSVANLEYTSAFENEMEKQHRYYRGRR